MKWYEFAWEIPNTEGCYFVEAFDGEGQRVLTSAIFKPKEGWTGLSGFKPIAWAV